MELKKLKSAQGNIEMILSFALFVGCVAILFYFLNPFSNNVSKDNNLDEIKNKFIDSSSSNINELSVFLLIPGSLCYNSPRIPGENISEVYDDSHSKYQLYYSNELNENSGHRDVNCDIKSFRLGVNSEEKILIYEKIKNLKIQYKNNYVNFKNSIGATKDFSFNFKYINGTNVPELSVTKNNPLGVERFAKEFPVVIIDNNGNKYEMILNIRSW